MPIFNIFDRGVNLFRRTKNFDGKMTATLQCAQFEHATTYSWNCLLIKREDLGGNARNCLYFVNDITILQSLFRGARSFYSQASLCIDY